MKVHTFLMSIFFLQVWNSAWYLNLGCSNVVKWKYWMKRLTSNTMHVNFTLFPGAPCWTIWFYWILKEYFLTGELSLINAYNWRADHEKLIHDGESQSESIFVFAQQHVNQQYFTVRKTILILIFNRMKMQGCCDVYKWTFSEPGVARNQNTHIWCHQGA